MSDTRTREERLQVLGWVAQALSDVCDDGHRDTLRCIEHALKLLGETLEPRELRKRPDTELAWDELALSINDLRTWVRHGIEFDRAASAKHLHHARRALTRKARKGGAR